MSNSKQALCRARQSGFTLIEVLVSALVLSIGLIGIAGLQAASLTNNQGAFMRSQATTVAYDLADRMRSNVPGANAGFYVPGAAAANTACGTTTGCSTQQMAQNDIFEWNAAIATYMPMGQGFVCIDSTPNDGADFSTPACDGAGTQFAVKVWWDDDRDGAISGTNTERQTITFEL